MGDIFKRHIKRCEEALAALCTALTAIILWSAVVRYFCIPTGESHALIAGITGAMAFMYGVRDGQKFIGVFMLRIFLAWLITFPCCGIIGYLAAGIFIYIIQIP